MKTFQKKLIKIPLFRALSSLRITVTCLFLFFLLTFWGTIYQVEFGLYAAQEKFFNSLLFPIVGSIPFPGTRLVLWVLFINLVFAALVRFNYQKKNIGIYVIHIGLLTFFVSSFVTFHLIEESNVTLMEEEGTNVSEGYHEWEIALIEDPTVSPKKVMAYDSKYFKPGDSVSFDSKNVTIQVKEYFSNSDAYAEHQNAYSSSPISASGIKYIAPKRGHKEPERNLPGTLVSVSGGGESKDVLLFGAEKIPTQVVLGDKTIYLKLQKKKYPLPFLIKLIDFRRKMHPGTETPASFESTVEIDTPGGKREVIISMNEPLRYKNHTLFQASYGFDEFGREYSTFATVKNEGRVLPYISTFLTFIGLALHFILMFANSLKKRNA